MNKKWWTGALALLIIAIGIFIYLYFFHGNNDPMLADKGSGISSDNSSISTNTNNTNNNTSTNSNTGNNTSFNQGSNGSTNTASNSSSSSSTNYDYSNNQSTTGSQSNAGRQTPAKFDTEAPSTYLIYGRDRSINEDTGETDEQVIETDMVLVVTLDPKARSVQTTFIPPNTAVGSSELKSLYNKHGVTGLIAGVEEVTAKQIDFYIGVDYEPFIQLVDVLKGLEVRMDEAIELTKYGLLIHPGINKLNGEQTLKLLRLKRGTTTIVERIDRQKQVLNALYQRISSIRNLSQLQNFSQALLVIREKLETDISSDQILQGIKFFGMGIKSFNVDILTGELVEGLWVPKD